jgi:predicted transposase YbfD/YdcC
LSQQKKWVGLKSFGMVESERHIGDKVSVEYRYHINSLPLDVKVFANAVRSHWSIENSLHWVLDVTFREDDCRIRRGDAAENFSVLRRIALNILKQEGTPMMSQKRKRRRATYDDAFREKALFSRVL